ncbi:hypothetical protein ATCC90586_000319 [Pythium insidiosum]|nr:hypothetical protein ATCC90586_000319 [Pythium insidiosum]
MMQTRVDALLRRVAASRDAVAPGADRSVRHVVAFSGGVDSSLAAALVHRVFPEASAACLGVSPSLSAEQHAQARDVARHIGITLWECSTRESEHAAYVANKGQSCYYCKTTLYTTIQDVAQFAMTRINEAQLESRRPFLHKPVIYNGTNADDLKDPTRLGLVAAKEFDVQSPLDRLTKTEVRETAKYLGLPNWNAAASPCLRSRLQFGIEATERHLKQVEAAEQFIRRTLHLRSDMNMRVRFLVGQRAAVELDPAALARAHELSSAIDQELQRLGFRGVEIRPFRSGSLSGYQSAVTIDHHVSAKSTPLTTAGRQ